MALTEKESRSFFRKKIEFLERLKDEHREIERKIETRVFEEEKIKLKTEELENMWLSFGRSKEELPALAGFQPAGLKVPESWRDTEKKMLRLRSELVAIGEIDPEVVRETAEVGNRCGFLKRELNDLETAASDLKKTIADLEEKISLDFKNAFQKISDAFNEHFNLMFGGGRAKLQIQKAEKENPDETESGGETDFYGVEVELSIPRKKIKSLDMLSGGEKSLVSLAALFALISVSPPPFLVLDEIDASLDDANAQRFAELVKKFSAEIQFIIITHNKITMEAADILYGITMAEDGVSKVLSLKLEDRKP